MSTKIYNAYIFNGTLKEVFLLKTELQKVYIADVKNALMALKDFELKDIKPFATQPMANDALKNCQEKTIGNAPWMYLQDILKGIANIGFRETLNFSASMMLYSHEEKIIVQFFGIYPHWLDKYCFLQKSVKLLNSYVRRKKLVDFHYQNQTDKPSRISNKAWDEREKIWDEIFNEYTTFANAGFSYDFMNLIPDICYEFNEAMVKLRRKNEKMQTLQKDISQK
jgi:hypothetical protein